MIINNPDGKVQASLPYNNIVISAMATATTNYNLRTQQATFTIPNAFYLDILSDQDITIKFNETSNHAIEIPANERRIFDRQEFKNLFISNASGNNAEIHLYIK